jgi:hypothetical protein
MMLYSNKSLTQCNDLRTISIKCKKNPKKRPKLQLQPKPLYVSINT